MTPQEERAAPGAPAPPGPPRAPTVRWASELALLLSYPEEISARATASVVAAMSALRAGIERGAIPGIRDLHPGYCTLLVTLDPATASPERVESEVRRIAAGLPASPPEAAGRRIEVPVCYDAAFAPDLADIAAGAGVDAAEAARMHACASYRVCFLGFAPGFPYLAGLPESLAAPRLAVPRRRVAAGSVGIAGAQCGIYPFDTPGGWRLIGRTPLRLFDLQRTPPALFAPGDEIVFHAIPASEMRTA